MNEDRVCQLLESKAITPRQANILRSLIEDGVVEPCSEGASPSECKLWYAHLPPTEQRGIHVVTLYTRVYKQARKSRNSEEAGVHDIMADALQRNVRSAGFDEYLKAWLEIVEELPVLEAVAWAWMEKRGLLVYSEFMEIEKEDSGGGVTVGSAAASPVRLIRVLTAFKKELKQARIKPCALVDEIALRCGWWEEGSENQSDAKLYATLDILLTEDEFATVEELAKTTAMDLDRVQASIDRQEDELMRIGKDGVTYKHIWELSLHVRTRLKIQSLNCVSSNIHIFPFKETDH